ncbi:MAG: hypothetical protein ACFCAD_27970 [Pleurocapsa sp.]
MDFDILKNDFLKPLITLIIPGFIAIHSFLFYILSGISILGICWSSFNSILIEDGEISISSATVVFFTLLILSQLVGVVLEDLGSWIELGCRKLLTTSLLKDDGDELKMILAHKASNIIFCFAIVTFLFSSIALVLFKKGDIKNLFWISFVITIISLAIKFFNRNDIDYKIIIAFFVLVPSISVSLSILNLFFELHSINNILLIVMAILAILIPVLFYFFLREKLFDFFKKEIFSQNKWNNWIEQLPPSVINTDVTNIDDLKRELKSKYNNLLNPDSNTSNLEDDFKNDWKNYLNIQDDKEKIGGEYIRQIITRFKFELSMIWASFISALSYYYMSNRNLWIAFIILSSYLLFESYYSVVVLYKTRHALVNDLSQKENASKSLSIKIDYSINNLNNQ